MTGCAAGVPEVETTEAQAARQAMQVEFSLKPQDGRADTVLDVTLAPSFIVYNPLTLQRVAAFFHTAQVLASPGIISAHLFGIQ